MSLKKKIFLWFYSAILILFTISSIYTYRENTKLIMQKEQETLHMLSESIKVQMKEQLESAKISAISMANNTHVVDMFENRDREGLKDMLLPVYESISDNISQIQFHLPDSTSFLRLHQLEKFGDSLKDFRYTVNEANQDKKIIEGLEEGVAGYGFRVVVPISKNNNHLGTLEYGSDFGDNFLAKLKEDYSGDYFIYQLGEGSENILLSSTLDSDRWETNDINLETLIGRDTIMLHSKDKRENIMIMPFEDYKEEVSGYFKVVQDRRDLLDNLNKVRTISIIYTLSILIILAVIMNIFLNYAFKPINNLVDFTKEVAKGDLTKHIHINRRDEIGQLAYAFNKMIDELREVIGNSDIISSQVAASSQELSAASEQVSASSEEVLDTMLALNTTAKEQFDIVENSSYKIDQVIESINQVTENIIHVNKTSQNTLTLSNDGIVASQDAVKVINNIKDLSNMTTQDIQNLNEGSKEIGNIIEHISNIAEQTNLLALNAAIEAARAGEQGRGFAVVADEIKKLADESGKLSDDVAKIILDIQDKIKTISESMNLKDKEVEEGVSIVTKSSDTFEEILNDIQNVAKELQDISNITLVVSDNARSITSSFNSIKNASTNTLDQTQAVVQSTQGQSAAMEQITSSTIDLASMASDLKESISMFKHS